MSAVTSRFDSIEEAQEYIGLLREVVEEARSFIGEELVQAVSSVATTRRADALRLADFKLASLRDQLTVSRRLLNDLRSLRRMLYGERTSQPAPTDLSEPVGPPPFGALER